MIDQYLECYRRDLLDSVIPFWLKHSLDRQMGGYFTCLDRDGSVYDTTKYMWLQGRAVYMFSRLYNELEPRQEFLDAAQLGVDFIRAHGKDSRGRVYFSLTRDGRPYFFQRKPYAGVFYMMGLLENYKATGQKELLDEAVDMFWLVRDWINDPTLLDRPGMPGRLKCSNLADVMVLASMVIDLSKVHSDERYVQVMQEAIAGVRRHFVAGRRILVENVALDGSDISPHPEGRLFNPGHSIEVCWFLLHLVERLKAMGQAEDHSGTLNLALEALEGSLQAGWDEQFGGLFYFMDLAGLPTLQLESSMKLWWPHTEAIYALVLAWKLTGQERWLFWLQRVHQYAYSHFADPQMGDWFGYCDRLGNLTHTCKGGNYKGFFHVPRFLLMSIQAIEGRAL